MGNASISSRLMDVTGDVFSTRSEIDGDRVIVRLKGCLDMETAPELQRFLGMLTRLAQAGPLREVEFNTFDLYLMSSSSISLLATWIKGLKGAKPVCRIKFKVNPNLSWQRRTLDTVRRVAESIVSVE